jgi:pimeloyl-ACP methyl ester carboxylesterase
MEPTSAASGAKTTALARVNSRRPLNQLLSVDISETEFPSLDGLRLSGTFVLPSAVEGGAVLVHGGGVTREEGGFFTRLADSLADAGIASLRFDLRAHGASEGRQEDLTLAGIVNDIRAGVGHLNILTGIGPPTLIGASFGGGVSAFFASRYPGRLRRLVLFNPLLNYKKQLRR